MRLSVRAGSSASRTRIPSPRTRNSPTRCCSTRRSSDIEHGRYEIARLTLQTLINTYDTSEYLAKAKLLFADSWYREGGAHGLAQAEAEYKDFILFYPTMEESAEAQEKVCMIHYKQMEKADRDMMQALRAEEECRNVLVQFPNSKFAPVAQQRLRDIQEVLAEGEFRRRLLLLSQGQLPGGRGPLPGDGESVSRSTARPTRPTCYSPSRYSKMGPRFRQQAGEAYARIVREYPAELARSRGEKGAADGWRCRSPKWTRWPTPA